MADPLAALVRCPDCRRATLEPADGGRRCAACGASRPVRDGVLDLLPNADSALTPAQLLMEAPPIVRIYESRLWRRSPPVALLFGISFEREQETIFRAAELAGDETVVDLACGPGVYARPLARRVPRGRVVGVDLSRPMLVLAVRRAAEASLGNVGFVRGSALDLPFADAAVDVVNCCGALHLFPDTARALAEIRRVLRPGGRFTCATFRGLAGPLSRLVAPLSHALFGVRTFAADELSALVAGSGLVEQRLHHARGAWFIVSARAPRSSDGAGASR